MFHEHISIGVAAEGTRSPDGQLQPFKKGGFHLAVDLQATIIPITFVGAYEFNRKGDWHVYPGPVDLFFGDPISTEGLTKANVAELRDRVRNLILNQLHKGKEAA